MKFTRDICRLLGLGGDEEQMEVQGGAPDPADPRKAQSSSQVQMQEEDEEEEEEEEERTRRRAQRRRAKKRRQKQRKKERTEDASEGGPMGEEVNEAVSESDSEEEEEEEEWTAVPPRSRCNLDSVPVAVTREKSNGPLPRGTSEEEPVWDVSSAFVANAVSHIRNLKGLKTRTTQTREDQENEGGQVESREVRKRRGESLTVQGIQMFGRGGYSHAVDMFTAAIHCDPTDHRFYGNRSCCLWCLQRFPAALADAHRAVQLAPDWPKGHFRKGCALMGLKRFREAEASMLQVLLLDGSCKEASRKLLACRALQLTKLGSEEALSRALLEKSTGVQALAASPEAQTLKQDQSGSCRSLWVGNITLEVTERDVLSLFEMAGEIESVRVLHKRSCAFVNFKNANMAARALERLQGAELGSGRLVMRYPNRRTRTATTPTTPTTPMTPQPRTNAAGTQQSSAATGSRRCIPINGDECFYWRTSGCFYGDACRFKHTADQRGRDKKPWQP